MRCVLLKTAFLAVLAFSVCLMSSGVALAYPSGSPGNCAACHTPITSPVVETTTPTAITRTAGQTATFTVNFTNPNRTDPPNPDQFYIVFAGPATTGTSTMPLTAIQGLGDSSHKLVVGAPTEGTANWASKSTGSYYVFPTTPSTAASVLNKTFTFLIPLDTPADVYPLVMKAAGGAGGDWVQSTDLRLTVNAVPEPATLAMLLGGALLGFVCWRGRKHLAAK
jgi:hypothetical protein